MKSADAICFGTGLVALDVIVNGNPNSQPRLLAGGSCGNVLTILAFLGWKSYPIARLSRNFSSQVLFRDLEKQFVNLDLITQTNDGSTPVIIHRIFKNKEGSYKHKYEFKIPKTSVWLPSYKSVLSNQVANITANGVVPKVFFLDRMSRANIELAKFYKSNESIIFFEPSSSTDEKYFKECLDIADVIKFSADRLPSYRKSFPNRRVPIEIETLGDKGLAYRSFRSKSDNWKFIAAPKTENVLDTAGAGDWCSAGFISLLFAKGRSVLKTLISKDIERALEFGQFLGASNCSYFGARGLMYQFTHAEIIKNFKKYQKSKSISVGKLEPGFTVNDDQFDYSLLL